MDFLDTQIISYKYKNAEQFYRGDISGKCISSIVALEFLRTIDKNSHNSARYYPCFYRGFHARILHMLETSQDAGIRRMHSEISSFGRKNSADKVIIDLNNQYDSFVIFSNWAVSTYLNKRNKSGILCATEHLDKEERRKISERIDFLLDNNLQVVPLNPSIIEGMLSLLQQIEGKYNVKDNYKNSIMDLLIASTAIQHQGHLITQDRELNRAIRELNGYKYTRVENLVVDIDTTEKNNDIDHMVPIDSKGYINRGWRYSIQKGNFR